MRASWPAPTSRNIGVVNAIRRPGPDAMRAGVLAVVTALALLALRLEATPLLRGPAPYPPEWQWAVAVKPWSGRIVPALACALGLILLLLLSGRAAGRQRPRAAGPTILVGATLLGLGLQLALRHVDHEGAVAALVSRTISGSFTSYHRVAVSGVARDPLRYLARHHETLPGLRHRALHAATHPPGPVLFYRGLIELCRRSTALTARLDAIVADSKLATASLASPPPSPESIGAALLGPLLLGLFGALACWPVAALARSVHGDAAAAARAGVLWTMVPAVALMTPEVDQALALPVTASIASLAAALRPEAPGPSSVAYAAAAGLLAAIAEFFSYGSVVFLLIGALAVLAFAGPRAPRRAALAAGVALTAAMAVIAVERLLGHRPLASALTALSIHRQQFTVRRSYVAWVAFDPVDLFWFLGPPLAVLVAAIGARSLIRSPRGGDVAVERFQAAAVLGVGALVLSGIVRGEAGRILIPVMPVLLVAAVAGKEPGTPAAGPSVGTSVLLAVLLTMTSVVIRLTWDVP
jgi:hypothetical protein